MTLCVALTADQSPTARSLAASQGALLGLTDGRGTARRWRPLVAVGAVEVHPDAEGDWTETPLLDQELRKSEHSRRLADTPLRRREYWWYLPRWIVTLRRPERILPVAARAADDGLLCADLGGALLAETVAVSDWADARVELSSLTPDRALPDAAEALLFGHDRRLPDGEPLRTFGAVGELAGQRLTVEGRWGEPGPPPPARLLDRAREVRRLRLSCEAAIRRGELGGRLG